MINTKCCNGYSFPLDKLVACGCSSCSVIWTGPVANHLVMKSLAIQLSLLLCCTLFSCSNEAELSSVSYEPLANFF